MLPTYCLSVFDHFVGLVLKRLSLAHVLILILLLKLFFTIFLNSVWETIEQTSDNKLQAMPKIAKNFCNTLLNYGKVINRQLNASKNKVENRRGLFDKEKGEQEKTD